MKLWGKERIEKRERQRRVVRGLLVGGGMGAGILSDETASSLSPGLIASVSVGTG